MKIVVIGGVAAGMSAASKAKRMDATAQVLVFEQGGDISYGACGLPYYASGKNPDEDKLIARPIEVFRQQGIEVFVRHQVLAVQPHKNTVRVRALETGREWNESYDKLMLATGAEAIRPGIPGVNLPGVYTLKTFDDGRALHRILQTPRRVAIVGGGYIGMEAAETLREAGHTVCVAEAGPSILTGFDPEVREKLHKRMVDNGILVRTGAAVEEILQNPDGTAGGIGTSEGSCPADVVILAIGVRPATGFLQSSGVALAPNGAVVVDRRQQTSQPDVYAAGDCALAWNPVAQDFVYSPLGTVANKCGRVAGENMAGGNAQFPGCLGSAAILVCGMEAGRTGLGEEEARLRYGEDVATAFIEDWDHPAYYPGAAPLWVKLICQKSTGRLLGGQTVGTRGAALRCQTLATAITAGASAHQLGFADLGYAPPFSKAWDALNIAGNVLH